MSGWYRTLVKYYEMPSIEAAQSDAVSIPPMAHYRCVVACSPIGGPTTLGGFRPGLPIDVRQPAPKSCGTRSAGRGGGGLAPASIPVSAFHQPCTSHVLVYNTNSLSLSQK